MSKRNRILDVKRGLIDVPGGVIVEQLPATAQVERNQRRVQIRVCRKPESATLIRVHHARRTSGVAVGVYADRVEGRVRDAELEILKQAGLFQIHAVLEIVMAFGGGNVGLHTPVQKLPLLALGGGQIVEGI